MIKALRTFGRMMRIVRHYLNRIPVFHRFREFEDIPEFLVVSPGGVATTMLIDYLSHYVSLNDKDDEDGLKHPPNLPRSIGDSVKIIYVYGDSEEIYESLRRRGWVDLQGAKLGCLLCVLSRGPLQKTLFMRAVDRQKQYFLNAKKNVMLLRYEDIWDSAEEIRSFLGIDAPEFVEIFPPRKQRGSN